MKKFEYKLWLLFDDQKSLPRSKTATNNTQDAKKPNRLPLRKLFYEDREIFSCSSLEADDIDNLEPETYCVWTPKEEGSPGSCKKSSSTRSNGSSKILFTGVIVMNKKSGLHHQRLGSDDQDGNHNKQGIEKRKEAEGVGRGLFQFQEHYYVRSKEGDKRHSYLPYRPDLVGFLSNVNGVERNLHPF
ncbi:PREDICTED: uncharacterized protein LOC105138946 [Populus euphratica]|uniref:Uncharacterized protein LOC105138946 n=1 Tax=Populus euphratica TaxID=75702 RepID=A0AAJ6V8E2_POPEU|nr:PREDICTED: uncharacterized protein LOC105138946 [Populus euphratica]